MRTLRLAACMFLCSVAAFGQSVTFNKDVLPILQKNCQGCHRPGQAGPMSFLSYDGTRPWAKAMKAAVVSKKMPPWGADSRYGHFKDDPSLTPSEIETITKWADTGALEGDAKDAPPPVQWAEGWRSEPDVVMSLPPFEVPAKGVIEKSFMTLPSPFNKDTWVTSIEVNPGQRAVMHHAGVTFVPHRNGVKYGIPVWAEVSRDEKGVEIPSLSRLRLFTFCSHDHLKGCPIPESEVANYNSSPNFEGFYRPGGTPIDYAYYDSAYLVPANSDIVLSLHYNPNGRAVTDVTKVGFTLAKGEPHHQLKMYTVPPKGGYMDRATFRIPANEPDWKAPPADAIFNVDAELALLSIHMHERGKVMTYTLTYPDGKSQIVLSEPRYNFNWQFTYELAKTIKIPKGTRLHVDAWYDNSSNNPFNRDPNRDVYGGDQSWEEMMAPWIGLILPGDFDAKKENVFTSNPD